MDYTSNNIGFTVEILNRRNQSIVLKKIANI